MFIGAIGVTAAVATAGRAEGGIAVFTDRNEFLAAVPRVREIDFETLPDGSPSVFETLITPDFNYTSEGVTFSSPEPFLAITGNAESGFNLRAGLFGSGGPRNWIIADLVEPAFAVGVLYPGGTILSAFEVGSGTLITQQLFAEGGDNRFGGIVSDRPIGSVILDRGLEVHAINSFFFSPIPEPASGVLLVLGALMLIRERASRPVPVVARSA